MTPAHNGNPLDLEYWQRIDQGLTPRTDDDPPPYDVDAGWQRLQTWMRTEGYLGDEDDQ